MGNYTKQDIIQLVEEKDVQFIRLQFTDVSGNLKNVAITASQLERALDNKCMFEGDSRYVLKNVLKRASKMGYTFDVGPECEFFLFHTDDNGQPTNITHEKASYFDVTPLDLGENARRDIVLTLESMGFEIEDNC